MGIGRGRQEGDIGAALGKMRRGLQRKQIRGGDKKGDT